MELNLVDSHFAHEAYCVPGVEAERLLWRRSDFDESIPTVFSHESMYRSEYSHLLLENRMGLLLESKSVIPRVYRKVESVMGDYSLVFTHSERLLARFPNARWIPGGGVWVGGSFAGGEMGLHPKSRNVSFLSSKKTQTAMHRKRLLWAWRLERRDRGVDVFRQKMRSARHLSVVDTLRDYRYSVCIENYIDERYFTEKVLNCFASGVVPIYMGARRLADFFNPDGFIAFNSYPDLVERVLPSVNEADYERRLPAIKENLARVSEFRSVEDYIVRNYLDSMTRG